MFNKINVVKRQQGVSLLELMLSLAIIAVILTMATRFYRQTDESRKANEAYQATVGLVAAIDNWKAANPTRKYSDMDINAIAGFFPADYMPDNDFVYTGARLSLASGAAQITGLPNNVGCGLAGRIQHMLEGKATATCATGNLTIQYIDRK